MWKMSAWWAGGCYHRHHRPTHPPFFFLASASLAVIQRTLGKMVAILQNANSLATSCRCLGQRVLTLEPLGGRDTGQGCCVGTLLSCVRMSVGVRSCFITLCLIPLRQRLSVNLELGWGQQAILLSLLPTVLGLQAAQFFLECWGSELRLILAQCSSYLPTKASHCGRLL